MLLSVAASEFLWVYVSCSIASSGSGTPDYQDSHCSVCASVANQMSAGACVHLHQFEVVSSPLVQIDKDREANVTDAAIEALGAVAAHLPWVQYEQLLNQWLKVMKKISTKVSHQGPLLLPFLAQS